MKRNKSAPGIKRTRKKMQLAWSLDHQVDQLGVWRPYLIIVAAAFGYGLMWSKLDLSTPIMALLGLAVVAISWLALRFSRAQRAQSKPHRFVSALVMDDFAKASYGALVVGGSAYMAYHIPVELWHTVAVVSAQVMLGVVVFVCVYGTYILLIRLSRPPTMPEPEQLLRQITRKRILGGLLIAFSIAAGAFCMSAVGSVTFDWATAHPNGFRWLMVVGSLVVTFGLLAYIKALPYFADERSEWRQQLRANKMDRLEFAADVKVMRMDIASARAKAEAAKIKQSASMPIVAQVQPSSQDSTPHTGIVLDGPTDDQPIGGVADIMSLMDGGPGVRTAMLDDRIGAHTPRMDALDAWHASSSDDVDSSTAERHSSDPLFGPTMLDDDDGEPDWFHRDAPASVGVPPAL